MTVVNKNSRIIAYDDGAVFRDAASHAIATVTGTGKRYGWGAGAVMNVNCSAINGAGATLVLTLQASKDDSTYDDIAVSPTWTLVADKTYGMDIPSEVVDLDTGEPYKYLRCKSVVAVDTATLEFYVSG